VLIIMYFVQTGGKCKDLHSNAIAFS